MVPKEIERKFLIRTPDFSLLEEKQDYHSDRITQTYLKDTGATTRVRRRERNGAVTYTRTSKVRINALSCYEDERTLTEAEYEAELAFADTKLRPIEKIRHSFQENGLTYEIDVYPFWDGIAVLEAELESEEQALPIPDCLTVLAEVTADRRFKNRGLAESIPDVTEFLSDL